MYQKLLIDDGVELRKDSVPEATAKGSYRHLLSKAAGLKWENVASKDSESKAESSEDPVVTDARFTFELPSGCYATMMLRELMVTTMARDGKKLGAGVVTT